MPNQSVILYIIDKFKTMNRKLRKELLPKDTAYTAQNVRFDNTYGNLEKRLSRSKFNTASLGVTVGQGLHRFYKNNNDSAVLLLAYGGAIKRGYDPQGAFSNAITGLNASMYFIFLTYKNLEYIFNGANNNYVFTYTNATGPMEIMGCPSHASVPSATLSETAGLITGAVNYAVSYQYDGYQEGNACESTALLNATTSMAKVVVPTMANTRCTGFYLYRTKSNTSTLYRLAAITNNTAAYSYTDNTPDTSLDLTITAPIDYGIPVKAQFGCIHKERLFLNDYANKSDIQFSDIRNGTSYPDVFPSTNRLYISRDDGDELTFILNDQVGQLIAGKKNSIRIINTSADSPRAWDISDSFSNQGCIAWRSAQTTPIGIVYLTRFGELKKRLVLWTGAGIRVMPELEGLEPILTDIPETALNDLLGHYHNGYYYLAYRTEGDYNDKVLVVNILDWSWSIDTKQVSSFCSWNGGDDFGELYTVGSHDGFVYREDADTFDLLIRKKSELDQGTYSDTESRGTEESPVLGMNSAALTATYAGRTWASMTEAGTKWEDMTAVGETWWYTAEWLDTVRDISARAFSQILWKETRPTDTSIAIYFRTGNTTTACEAAAWNGPYVNPDGSNISSVSAAKYIQILARLGAKTLPLATTVNLSRTGTTDTDYVIKVSSSYGDPAESTIELDWQSGRLTLGDLNETFKRLRKRLRSVKIEYERDDITVGNFTFYWYLDGATAATGSFNTEFLNYPTERIYNFPLSSFCEDFWYRIYTNTDTKSLKIKRIIFTISTEKYTVLK